MNRLEMNDLLIKAHIETLELMGCYETAERVRDVYEIQRLEIIANQEEK